MKWRSKYESSFVHSELNKGRYFTASLQTDYQIKEISQLWPINAIQTRAQALKIKNKEYMDKRGNHTVENVLLSLDAAANKEDISFQAEIQESVSEISSGNDAFHRHYLNVSDLELVLETSEPSKLSVQCVGPDAIEKKISRDKLYCLVTRERKIFNALKPYYKTSDYVKLSTLNPEQNEVNGHVEFPHIGSCSNVYSFRNINSDRNLERRLNPEQIYQFQQLLIKYSENFSNIPGKTNAIEHDIEQFIMTRTYRVSLIHLR
ncbi:retrovirus-related Pol polyprotein from transposon 17.6 [Nephila pilipes]|uniref:Retrovirus-related Pol polyprotein from transposon 17.6 n=1 Tax=Nephila pilipes TaxID=299642 RepID=A0A8X6Q7K2_NEPPI|nr:retrovirus-related Pol polyprotein from transposon 17.6 [Nephila pilipes]